MRQWFIVAILCATGCRQILGLEDVSVAPVADAPVVDAPPACSPETRDPAGCACPTVNAMQACYLGDPGPMSICRQGGTVTCGADDVWGACIGGTPPAREVCFDGVDNDCDGVVDNGCVCAGGDNLCLDPATALSFAADHLWVVPSTISRVQTFRVIAVSASSIVDPALQTDSGACTGAITPCSVGGACAGWFAVEAAANGGTPWFSTVGSHTVKILRNSVAGGAPCNPPNYNGEIVGSIVITP